MNTSENNKSGQDPSISSTEIHASEEEADGPDQEAQVIEEHSCAKVQDVDALKEQV